MGAFYQMMLAPIVAHRMLPRRWHLEGSASPLDARWIAAAPDDRHVSIAQLVKVCEQATQKLRVPALVLAVYDSDVAVIAASPPEPQPPLMLLLGEDLAVDWREGDEPLRYLESLFGEFWHEAAAAALAAWSVDAPKQISTEDVIDIMNGSWVVVDDPLDQLLNQLGLTLPPPSQRGDGS